LSASFHACQILTRRHAKSFYFASHALPERKRLDAYAVYAFCRVADDAVDLAPTEEARQAAVGEIKILLEKIYSGGTDLPDWGPAFVDTVTRCHLPRSYFEDLLIGLEMDQGRVRIADWPELQRYCYHVASVVGLLMTRVFTGPRPDLEPHAMELGLAMQLTNIVRDVKEDLVRDRIYLPATEMAQFGVTEDDLRSDTLTSGLHALLRFQVQRARNLYAACEPGIRGLPNDGSQLTVQLMQTLYAAILDEIEQQEMNVLAGRASTSFLRKCALAIQAWRQCR
jgi:phytoene synthase